MNEKHRSLTPKQQRFIEEYLIDLNATQAAIRAGYKHPDNGRQLLTKTHVSDAIATAQAARSKRLEVDQDQVLTHLMRLAFSNILDYLETTPDGGIRVSLTSIDANKATAIRELIVDTSSKSSGEQMERVRVKLADPLRALELLGKHLGMFDGSGRPQKHDDIDMTRYSNAELIAMIEAGDEAESLKRSEK